MPVVSAMSFTPTLVFQLFAKMMENIAAENLFSEKNELNNHEILKLECSLITWYKVCQGTFFD